MESINESTRPTVREMTQVARPACPHCGGTNIVTETTGGLRMVEGDPIDDTHEHDFCMDCLVEIFPTTPISQGVNTEEIPF